MIFAFSNALQLRKKKMAKGYWVAAYRAIHDVDRLAAYGALAGPVVKAAGGKFLVRGGEVVAAEAGLEQRTVVVEFPSFEQALAAYQSEAYQKVLAVLGDGAERDARIVAGVED
ncbi:DUF1330 domain-containing protein [Pseudomonas izuensis]|uniref:DUF1330 domain-containing protein n=1 Tax=Pseudomonas izuensis TaxID=2684212 RepID=UPI001FE6C588|nr:DUF1330 domain-containing protein [Pseudomonas izuensis]